MYIHAHTTRTYHTHTTHMRTHSHTHTCRGVACIFVEMLTGKPLFPGIKGVFDQLNKIWMVRNHWDTHKHSPLATPSSLSPLPPYLYLPSPLSCFLSSQLFGTPSESTWPGISLYPEYKPCECVCVCGCTYGCDIFVQAWY